MALISVCVVSLWSVCPLFPEPFEVPKRAAAVLPAFFAIGLLMMRGGLGALAPALLVMVVAGAATLGAPSLEASFWGRRPFRDGLLGLLPVLAVFAASPLAGSSLAKRLAWGLGLAAGLFSLVLLLGGSDPQASLRWISWLDPRVAGWIHLSSGRPGGALGNAAWAGNVLAIIFCLVWGAGLSFRHFRGRMIFAALAGLIFLGVVRTGTWASLLGCGAGLIGGWVVVRAQGHSRRRMRNLFLFVCFTAASCVWMFFPWDRPMTHGAIRKHLGDAAVRAWIKKPFLGWGPEGMASSYPGLFRFEETIPEFSGLPRSSHMIWGDIAVSFGTLGLLLALGLVALALKRGLRGQDASKVGALLALMVGSCFHRVPFAAQILGAYLIARPPIRVLWPTHSLGPIVAGLFVAVLGSSFFVRTALGEVRIGRSESKSLSPQQRLTELDYAKTLRPEDPEILASRARLLAGGRALHDIELAHKVLLDLEQVDPAFPGLQSLLMRVSRRIYLKTFVPGDLADARAKMIEGLRKNPRSRAVLEEAAAVLLETQEERYLMAVIERAKKVVPSAGWPWAYLGYVQARAGQLEDARVSLEKALQQGFGDKLALEGFTRLNLGVLLFRQGEEDNALSQVLKAAELIPEDPEVHYHLGLFYLARGSLVLGEAAFQRTLFYAPDHTGALQMMQRVVDMIKGHSKANRK